jgi:hypothetical protein
MLAIPFAPVVTDGTSSAPDNDAVIPAAWARLKLAMRNNVMPARPRSTFIEFLYASLYALHRPSLKRDPGRISMGHATVAAGISLDALIGIFGSLPHIAPQRALPVKQIPSERR